jgi:hypothetical protein
MLLPLLIVPTAPSFSQQSLDDVLGVGKSDLGESKPETKKLWNDLVTALEQGNIEAGKDLAQKFADVIDYTEPYQKNFAAIASKLLNANLQAADATTSAAISDVEAQITTKNSQLTVLQNKSVELQKKLKDANTSSAVIGGLFGAQLGGIAGADKQNVQTDINQNNQSIADVKSQIRELEQKVPELEAQGRQVQQEIRNQAYNLAKELIDGNYFREAIALSNVAIKKMGQDADFVRLSQNAVDAQKLQLRAVAIAKAATADAAASIAANRLWEAKVEMEKSIATISDRVNDAALLKYTQIEMGKITRDLTRNIEGALKARGVILQAAQRDAFDANKRYTVFLAKYPDYPDADADKLALSDLQTAQVEAKFAKRIAEIQEVIANDPAEAKEMIKRLIADNTDPDQVSIIRSRMSKLEKVILQEEIKRIQSKLDEAQSYLTKWNVTYAESLKKGEQPTASFIAALSGGTENLTRAISVQEGVVKQIDVLLTEPMDTVTKSQVVGLQETAKGALDYMQVTKKQAESNKSMIMIGGIIVVLAIIGGVVFFLMGKKKKVAAAA